MISRGRLSAALIIYAVIAVRGTWTDQVSFDSVKPANAADVKDIELMQRLDDDLIEIFNSGFPKLFCHLKDTLCCDRPYSGSLVSVCP